MDAQIENAFSIWKLFPPRCDPHISRGPIGVSESDTPIVTSLPISVPWAAISTDSGSGLASADSAEAICPRPCFLPASFCLSFAFSHSRSSMALPIATAAKLRGEDAKKWTQAKVAEALGVDQATVSRWFDIPNMQTHKGSTATGRKPKAGKKKATENKTTKRLDAMAHGVRR